MIKLFLIIFILCTSIPAYANWQEITQSQPYLYKAINSAATTIVKSGAGILHTLVVTGGTAGTINVYDSTGGATSNIANYSSTNTPNTYVFDVGFTSGCTVVTGGATSVTISYL